MRQTPLKHVESTLEEMNPMEVPDEAFDYCDSMTNPKMNFMDVLRNHLDALKRDIENDRTYLPLDQKSHCALLLLTATGLEDQYSPSDLYSTY